VRRWSRPPEEAIVGKYLAVVNTPVTWLWYPSAYSTRQGPSQAAALLFASRGTWWGPQGKGAGRSFWSPSGGT
jgi:hypothetical protein